VHTGYEWNKYNQTHYECVIHVFSLFGGSHGCLARTILPQKSCKDIRFANCPRPVVSND
jgi:hypothetical protein